MKKKIKDLTPQERRRICILNSSAERHYCLYCFLYKTKMCYDKLKHKERLELEVEVDE